MNFSLEILGKNDDECILILVIYWKKTELLHILLQEIKPFTSSDAGSHDLEANFTIYLTIKMLYNSCTGIYKFGNNTYPRGIRCRSNLGHIFRGKKSASYGLGYTVNFKIIFKTVNCAFVGE
jgi:hypothetical protein